MRFAAGWAGLALLGCLPLVVDSSVPGGPRASFGLLVLVVVGALPAFIGGLFVTFEEERSGQPRSLRLLALLRRVPRLIRIGSAVVALAGIGIFVSGMVKMPSGMPLKTDSGYALRLKNGEVVPATEERYLADRRAERRVFLGLAILSNAAGGTLCWAAKLRDDEEDPI